MRTFNSFITQKGFLFKLGLIICTLWILVVIFAPLIATHSTTAQDLSIRYQSPSFSHFFGTDELGRDVFSRVMYGSRISLTAGIITVTSAFAFGILYGGIAGY